MFSEQIVSSVIGLEKNRQKKVRGRHHDKNDTTSKTIFAFSAESFPKLQKLQKQNFIATSKFENLGKSCKNDKGGCKPESFLYDF